MRKTRSTRKVRGGKASYILRTQSTDSKILHEKNITPEEYKPMINNRVNIHNYVVGDNNLRENLDVSKVPTIELLDGDTTIVATYPPTFIEIIYSDKIHQTTNVFKTSSGGGSRRRKRRKSKKRKNIV